MQKLIAVLLKLSIFIFLISGLLGFYYLTGGQEGDALFCAKVGGFASLVFSTIALFEVVTHKDMRFSTKFFWVAAILLFQLVAAVAYYLATRRSIKQPVLA